MTVTSGVPGFDDLVGGGLPAGAAVVVQGPAGAEKDAFLFQFVVEGLSRGAAVLVVLSSVSPARFQQNLESGGVDAAKAIAENRLKFVDWFTYKEKAVQDVEAVGPTYRASADLANVGLAVSRAIAALPREREKRAAVEILSPALHMYELPNVYAFAQSTKAKLERFGFTSLFVVEKEMHDERTLSSLHQPFDGVVDIERVREGDALVRRIAVLSLKGTAARSKYVPVEIGKDRILRVTVVPSRENTLHRQEELIKGNPKDPKLWIATARNLRAMGENERALKCVEAALKLDASDQEAWRFKAEILDALGRRQEAQTARAHATLSAKGPSPVPKEDAAASRLLGVVEPRLRANPRDTDALFVKAAILAKTGDTKGALETLESLVLVDETHPALWILKAKLHAQRKELKEAWECRQRAEEIEGYADRAPRQPRATIDRPAPTPPAPRTCPECGAAVAEGEIICPSCRAGRGGVEGRTAPPPTPAPTPEREVVRPGLTNGLARRVGPRTGRTNGLVKVMGGHTNGLVNGTRGRTNGLVKTMGGRTNGLVNGLRSMRSGMTNGLTNGSGFTNGLGSRRYAREVGRDRWKLFLIPLTAAVLAVTPFLTVEGHSGPAVDGAFDDWQGVPRYTLSGAVNDTNLDLVAVSLQRTDARVFLRVEVAGPTILAGGPNPPGRMDAIYVFVDADRDVDTGYVVRGIGADRLLEIQGAQGQVLRATAYRYGPVADRRDWRGWMDPAAISAVAAGSSLELAVDWLFLEAGGATPAFLVMSLGWHGSSDAADLLVGLGCPLLRVTQRHVQPQTLVGTNAPLLSIQLAAASQAVAVSSLRVELLGTAPLSAVGSLRLVDAGAGGALLAQRVPLDRTVAFTFPAVSLAPGATKEWTLSASLAGSAGATLGARIPASGDVGADANAITTLVTDASAEALGYLGGVPGNPIVDGAFGEWANETADGAGEASTGGNPSIDLARFGAVAGATNLSFHVAVRGRAFSGTVPTANTETLPAAPTLSDRDRDTVPDDPAIDPLPDDFNNDGTPDALTNGDRDGDGVTDYISGGPDCWLNTTIPATFPPPYGGRNVSVYVGPTALPPAIGEDRLRLFVDADNVAATGYYLHGIGADYLVEIAGREGELSMATVSSHIGDPWTWGWTKVSDLSVALGLTQLEGSADIPIVVPEPAWYVEIGDWRNRTDELDSGTRGGTRSLTFTGPDPAFVPTEGGEYAYRSTGAALEAYVRASRGAGEELVLRDGALFLGWRTERLGGVSPTLAEVRVAGPGLVVGGFQGAWEEYELSRDRVKHNVWMATFPPTTGDNVALEGTLRIPAGASVLVEGNATTGPFATDGAIVVEYEGRRVRLQAPYAYESRDPRTRVAGRYEGEVAGATVRIAMTIPAAWLHDPVRRYPVVLDPTGIIDTSNPATGLPTHGPYARNVVYDGANFWGFYYDGTGIRYEPSSDGLSWVNTKNYFFTTANIAKVSVWFHDTGTTKILYAVGDSTSTSKTVAVQRGTISGTTVTWAGSDGTVTVSTAAETKRAFITRDSGGYLWVAASAKDGGGAWNFTATRSTNTDDITAWGAFTALLPSPASNNNIQGVILPLGSGEVYAIWYADGNIAGRKYSGSWGSSESIDTTSAANLALAPSAVVDASYNVHLVYVDSAGAVKYRQRTTSWSAATTLDSGSGNTYATISVVTDTGNLYAFWISGTYQMKAKVYSGGSWADTTLETNTNAKTRLTSIYSASSTSSLSWVWTQGSAAPYDVKFSVYTTSRYSRTIDTSTDSTAVSYNHQRKVFFDGTYFWAFYFDGTNSVYTCSPDALTWEHTVSSAFASANGDNPSVWYYSGATKVVYLVGDESSGDKTVMVRKGMISGTTITWVQNGTAPVSSNNLATKIAFIARDSSGYLWVISNDAATSSTYNIGVVRSSNTDDVTTWPAGFTALLTTSRSVNWIYPTILPLSGGDMYAFWYVDGLIAGKPYTGGSWGAQEGIASTTSGVATKIPSGVVDASYNVDLVYIDSTGQVVFRQRTSSWGSNTTLDSSTGSTSPTITFESGTGNLYAYYISSSGQIKGQKYTTSWATITTNIDTSTITKTFLTSVYSVSNSAKVAWLWDQGGTSPYEVKVSTTVIPEFQEAVVPSAIAVGTGLASRLRRRSRRAPS